MTDSEGRKILESAVSKLGEHFDHVQILVTWQEGEITHRLQRGYGNWYARQGLAHEFINEDVARENAEAIGEKIKPPEDE